MSYPAFDTSERKLDTFAVEETESIFRRRDLNKYTHDVSLMQWRKEKSNILLKISRVSWTFLQQGPIFVPIKKLSNRLEVLPVETSSVRKM